MRLMFMICVVFVLSVWYVCVCFICLDVVGLFGFCFCATTCFVNCC